MIRFNLIARTITPVSIGNDSGAVLSPYVDYIIKNDNVYYINHRAVEQVLSKKPQYIDEFVSDIRNSMNTSNTRSEFNLTTFLESKLNMSLDDYAQRKLQMHAVHKNKYPITRMLTNADKPYISGSTLKGAIKTAILYDWLIQKEAGKTAMQNIIRKINDVFDSLQDVIEDYEYYSQSDKQRANGYTKQIDSKAKELKSFIEEQAIEPLFENIGQYSKAKKRLSFSCVCVSDTSCLDKSSTAVYATARFSLRKSSTDEIPTYREGFYDSRMNMGLSISILPIITNSALRFLNQDDSIELLFAMINQFSLANLQYDAYILEEYDEDASDTMLDFAEENSKLMAQVENAESTKEAYLRVGFGKSYFYNSIGLAIWNANKDAFKKFVRLFRLGKPSQSVFPITRTVLTVGAEPLGWIKISKSN